MLRSLSATLCFIAVSAIPTARDAPARTATEVKATEVKALNDQIADVVSKQLQARDEEAKKVAALAAEEDAKLEAMAATIANNVAGKVAKTMAWTNSCACTSADGKALGTVPADMPCVDPVCTTKCKSLFPTASAGTCPTMPTPTPNPKGKCFCDGKEVPLVNDQCICNHNSDTSSSSPCFAKDSTTACLLASPAAECEHVLMADLAVGDLVLGREGATAVVAVQHKAVDTISEMLTFHTAAGAVSMTPDHAVFADGELVAAAAVKVGSILSTGAVKRITKGEAAIINPVTASGTIVADGVLAASNPMWIASLTVDAPITRAIVNAVLYAVGDVDTIAAGTAKAATTLALAALAAKGVRSRKVSSA